MKELSDIFIAFLDRYKQGVKQPTHPIKPRSQTVTYHVQGEVCSCLEHYLSLLPPETKRLTIALVRTKQFVSEIRSEDIHTCLMIEILHILKNIMVVLKYMFQLNGKK